MSFANIQMMIGIGAYLAGMAIIGLWYFRRSNTSLEEYFLAKRSFGPWVASMSAEASDMSGWLLVGLPGVAYFTGTWINWAVVAKRLHSYSRVADNAIISLVFFSIYVGAQFVTFGKLFSYIFDTNITLMVILVAFVVTFYTLLGAFRAVGMTDLIQGILMAATLVLAVAFFRSGGIGVIAEEFKTAKAAGL